MLGISNICKGYKSFLLKWNAQNKHSRSISESDDTSKEKDENDFIISYPSTPVGGLNHTHSIDDSLLMRRTLSRNKSSRRCKTPTPRSFSRSMSRSTTPNSLSSISSRRNPSEPDILASITRNLSREAEIAASISRNISRNMSSNKSSNLSRNASSRHPSESELPSPSPASPPPATPTPASPSPAASPSTARSPHTSKTTGTSETDPTTPLSRTPSRRSTTPIVFSQTTARRKPPPVEKKLEFTLEELCHGCVKKIQVTRDVINHAGIIVKEEEVLKINVQPGWRKGTKITFEGKGDEKPGYLPADIIFLIDEKRHHLFKRAGRDDLEIAVEIPLADALGGCSFPAPLLGGETMSLSFDEIIHHGYEKVIEGQGMPKLKEPTKRGDLRITCLVNFPQKLSDEQRAEAVSILQDCSYQ
ncbi:putative chaperone DnaJ [Rosa chinensis]|uniref:Putative chaperone DnaJ n=1 Tax=Rosa chinensis TaxID=74649 RepID=A0A2P6PD36_ROSCH|nr:rho GTPase-activating protein gacK-like [Rosa chinensis]PRQ19843.1 putative chaperone DnaJ [Rosa chinensis]